MLLVAYGYVAGGGASVVRATAMAVIYLALRGIDQRTSPLHAIALTAGAMLLAYPLEIADVGFWLTFGATAAIVTGAARLGARQAASPDRGWSRAPIALCLASIWVEIALLPVGAAVFQRVSVAGLVLNLAAVPSMGIVQVAAAATVMAADLGAEKLAAWVGLARYSAQALLQSARSSTWRRGPRGECRRPHAAHAGLLRLACSVVPVTAAG